jgi:hypothetical protein
VELGLLAFDEYCRFDTFAFFPESGAFIIHSENYQPRDGA